MNKKILLMLSLILPLLLTISVVGIAPVFADDVSVTFDVDGHLVIEHSSEDSSSWHPGEIGQTNTFEGTGSFIGAYSGYTGNYGSLSTYVNAEANSWAQLEVTDYQNFNVLSANHIYNTEGFFSAGAQGDGAELNLKMIGSMYVWSEATNPYSQPALFGEDIYKHLQVNQSDVVQTDLGLAVDTTEGTATLYNSNIWGWGISESGSGYTNYAGGTRTVTATGTGSYMQTGFGLDYLEFNGFVAPSGGSLILSGGFASGLTGTYSMSGN